MLNSIWIVDDDTHIVDALENYLRNEGFETKSFANAENCYTLLQSVSPNLIICDWMMEGMDGVEFVEKIRKEGCDIPIVMISVRSNPDDVVEGFEKGVDDYLSKPFSLKELGYRVKGILQRKKQQLH